MLGAIVLGLGAMNSGGKPVVMGKISGQHGVRGWVKVFSYTRPIAQILGYDTWLLGAGGDATSWDEVRVDATRQQPKHLLAKIAGVDDRAGAEAMLGKSVAVLRSQMPKLASGEYYWSDLVGLAVVNQDGVGLGVVSHLLETGANDVLVVRDADARERLLPWGASVVREVALPDGLLRVVWDQRD